MGEACGPIDFTGIHLGATADNPDTAEDESGFPLIVCNTPGVHTITLYLDRVDTPPGDEVILTDTVSCSPNTPVGADVSVPLNGGTGVVAGLSITFPDVTTGGTTTVVTTQDEVVVTELVSLLLKGEADVNARDHLGETPARKAAEHGHPGILRLLEESGGTIREWEADA